jgi:hypothetical protein
MMMNVIAGAGLVVTPLAVTASDFGGGWMQDKHTGTIYYSHAPEHGQNQVSSAGHRPGDLNSFGGGWVQDKHTGTISYSLAPEHGQKQASSAGHRSGDLNSFGGGWVQDKHTSTIYYSRAHDASQDPVAGGSQGMMSRSEGGWANEPVKRNF